MVSTARFQFVRLMYMYMYSIDAAFAASKVTSSFTKFNWALSKLPFSLIDSIGPLCPSSYRDPYQELQDILLRSYGLSASQRTGIWLDHPGCSNNRPSVMWDNLTALQPATVKEIQMQIAALHQRPDQPTGGPGAGGPHPTRIGAMKPRPPHNLTPLPGYPPLLLSVPREELCQ